MFSSSRMQQTEEIQKIEVMEESEEKAPAKPIDMASMQAQISKNIKDIFGGKSLERERGGLKGEGEAFLQKVSPFPPPISSISCHYSVAASSTISKASITSPTLMSLKFSRLMPHS